jgi:dihydrolipoamide dehydrogenase
MDIRDVDVVVLGAGTAGLNARRGAERSGASAVMVDPGPYGTTCARVGCMPSKLLIAAADAAHHANHAPVFGVHPGEVRVDGRQVMDRVKRERDRFVGFVQRSIDEHFDAERLIRGRGQFIGPNEVQVDDHTIVRFKTAVIATGSSPWTPPPFRGLGDVAMDNGGFFDLDDLPESMLVIGTGVIGLELGQALTRLGVRTTLVGQGGRVGPLTDPTVKAEAYRVFAHELDFHPDYDFESVRELPQGGVELRFDGRVERYERVLIAAGRRANIRGLGLEVMGLNPMELAIDHRTGQLGDSHVFIAGDVSNFRPLLHEAADEGRIAGENAGRYPQVEAHVRTTPLAVVFSDPQIGIVGQGFSDLTPGTFAVGEVDYGDQGRARVMNKNAGKVRIYAGLRCGKIKGAEMFGPAVEHTAHLLAWAIEQDVTVDQALRMPFYHPVVEEGLRTALRDLRRDLKFRGSSEPCPELRQSM